MRARRGRLDLAGSGRDRRREPVHGRSVQGAVANAYHRLYHYNCQRTCKGTRWLKHEVQKLALDVLAADDRFEIDASRERFWVTQSPRGYLRRVL